MKNKLHFFPPSRLAVRSNYRQVVYYIRWKPCDDVIRHVCATNFTSNITELFPERWGPSEYFLTIEKASIRRTAVISEPINNRQLQWTFCGIYVLVIVHVARSGWIHHQNGPLDHRVVGWMTTVLHIILQPKTNLKYYVIFTFKVRNIVNLLNKHPRSIFWRILLNRGYPSK